MNLREFLLLSEPDQEEYLEDYGIFQANYVDGNLICDTYLVMNFYVSCYYKVNSTQPVRLLAHSEPVELPLSYHLGRILKLNKGLRTSAV